MTYTYLHSPREPNSHGWSVFAVIWLLGSTILHIYPPLSRDLLAPHCKDRYPTQESRSDSVHLRLLEQSASVELEMDET